MTLKALVEVSCHGCHSCVREGPGLVAAGAVWDGAAAPNVKLGAVCVEVKAQS